MATDITTKRPWALPRVTTADPGDALIIDREGGTVRSILVSDLGGGGGTDPGALQKASNLSDLANAGTARTNLGLATVASSGAYGDLSGKPTLGGAAALNVGTTAGTVAAGDDARFSTSVQASQLSLGQCKLTLASATQLSLQAFNGNRLFINGTWMVIPSSGVALSNSGLSASTLYYVYAYNNAGTLTLEASTTGHSTSTSTGAEIKTGDATRALVGGIRTDASAQFQAKLVASWFNRGRRRTTGAFSVDRQTTSTTYVELHTEIRCECFVWAGETLEALFSGAGYGLTASDAINVSIGIDGITPEDALGIVLGTNTLSLSCSTATSPAEGYHYVTILGRSPNGGGGSTRSLSNGPGFRSSLHVVVG